MTAPERVAFAVAYAVAREWRYPRPLEFVGAAWEGADRAYSRGFRGRLLRVAARRAVIDQLRREYGDPRRHGRSSVRRAGPLPDVPAREESGDVDPVLSLWCRTRDARAGMNPRQRLRLALWLVERMTLLEIAQAQGCSPSAVAMDLRRALAGVPGAAAAGLSLAASRANLTCYRGRP